MLHVKFCFSGIAAEAVKILKRQFKCLERRSKPIKSGAPASSFRKCNHFAVMQFLYDKTANKPTESNLCLPYNTSHVSEKQIYVTTITEPSEENRPGKKKNSNPETNQKVTGAALLHQLKKWMNNVIRGREKVRIMKMSSIVKVWCQYWKHFH